MTSDRIQRQIERLLDEAEESLTRRDWVAVRERSQDVLALDPESQDGRRFLAAADRALGAGPIGQAASADPASDYAATTPSPIAPTSFAGGRYQVTRLLGEGGKKRVYLAHDTRLGRDVAFALIKADGLDAAGRARLEREARAMAQLGDHPHIVSVLDLGNEPSTGQSTGSDRVAGSGDQPYLVSQLMVGGDLEALLEQTPEHRLPINQAIAMIRQLAEALAHAHAHGVIHRDMKPGNVWLTVDGTAKLGDFGLAVALDQTRLTQPGMMVGTVSYMAPEQALGGNVDARSDLYALGALLYELVCGRPPFIGDESVAVITQHLNTPPVAPSWHRPDCPPGLEALILRLLEKDPSKRPASASEVVASLSNIDAAARGSPPRMDGETERGAGVANPLYHRAFVGREAELRQLEAAFNAAVSGRGGLVMVVGEPGIGKTSLCEQLATYASVRGATVLVGHCYEEGSLSLPYLPFVEAMRSYVLTREPEALRDELGSGAAEVGRIVSEIRDRVPEAPRPAGDPDEERWRLLQAVTGFLHNAAVVRPILLVLEDLHDADRGTLDLLMHLTHHLAGTRLLLVGTYRDVEVDRSHPLSPALAELRRSEAFSRIPLRGLTVDEVHRMMNVLRGQEVPWSRAEAIHRQTEGNPLFVQEVLRYLVEEGLVVREGDRWIRTDGGAPEAGIPEGLRDVIGKRLSRLSDATNRLLAIAAVIGREFRLDVLEKVAGLPEEELYGALDQARDRAVVEERAGLGAAVDYRFTHAFFRQTLYEELSAPRRIRLHQQVARALEEVHARRPDEHAAELAEHFAHSSDPDDLQKAVRYGELAAKRALAVCAYGEAVRHLEQVLEVQDLLDPDDGEKRCDVLLALGSALLSAGEPIRVAEDIAPDAFTLAETLGDERRASQACRVALEGMGRAGAAIQERRPEYRQWAARADRWAAPASLERVYADLALADYEAANRRWREATPLYERALALAREVNDPEALFRSASRILLWSRAPQHVEGTRRLVDEFSERSRDGVNPRTLGQILWFCALVYLEWGDRPRAEELNRQVDELAQRTREASLLYRPLALEAYLAVLDGRLEACLETVERLFAWVEELGAPELGAIFQTALGHRALLYLGRYEEAEATTVGYEESRAPLLRACALAHLGRRAEADRALAEFLEEREISSDEDETHLTHMTLLLEAAVLLEDRETAAAVSRRLAGLASLIAPGGYTVTSLGRHLGAAAVLLGKPREARAFYEQAIEACEKASFRPDLALSHLELAELLLDHYQDDRAEALQHLDFAIAELRDMKMQPALERALRRKLQLQGVDSLTANTSIEAVSLAVTTEQPDLRSHAAPDGTVTLLFTDIEDSTGLTLKLGDRRWLEILRAHHALVRQHVRQHGGFEVKNQGDGFMLAFGSARRALNCAVAIQRAVNDQNPQHPEVPIRVRMGLHTGEALKEAEDFHGKHVVLAARIANQAEGGEILVSGLLEELTESSGDFDFGEGRDVELKGLAGAHRVYAVAWR